MPSRLATIQFGSIVIGSVVIGVVTSIVGLYLSFHVDIASGPSIVLTGLTVFAGTLGIAGARRSSRTRSTSRSTRSSSL